MWQIQVKGGTCIKGLIWPLWNVTLGGGSVVVDMFFIVTPIVGVCNCSMFCCMLLYVHSSFVIILMGKRELVALLGLSSWCLAIVVWLFLAVLWDCLQFVIGVFLDYTGLLFMKVAFHQFHQFLLIGLLEE